MCKKGVLTCHHCVGSELRSEDGWQLRTVITAVLYEHGSHLSHRHGEGTSMAPFDINRFDDNRADGDEHGELCLPPRAARAATRSNAGATLPFCHPQPKTVGSFGAA